MWPPGIPRGHEILPKAVPINTSTYDFAENQFNLPNLSPITETTICIAYTFLIVMGVVLNSVCVFVVMKQRWRFKKQLPNTGYYRSRNLYILNLAIADLLLCLLELPVTLMRLLTYTWHLGSFFCKFMPFIQATNVTVAACTVMIIAIDRYNIIVRSSSAQHQQHVPVHVHPHKLQSQRTYVTLCSVHTTIVFIWVFSVLITCPMYFHTNLRHVTWGDVHVYDTCVDTWSSHRQKTLFVTVLAVVQFFAPFCVITAMHVRISSYLSRHIRKIPQPVIQIHSPNGDQIEEGLIDDATINQCIDGTSENRKSSICSENSQRSAATSPRKVFMPFTPTKKPWKRAQRELRRNRRTTIFLTCIAGIFAASWLPFNILNLYTNFNAHMDRDTHFILFVLCHLLAMSSVCVNPFLYGFLNTNFRKEFTLIINSFSRLCFLVNDSNNEKKAATNFINNNIINSNKDLGRQKPLGKVVGQKGPNCVVVTLVPSSKGERFL